MALELDFSLARASFTMQIQAHFPAGSSGIFGPSGAGKTSLFQVIAGLEKPQHGYIRLGDRVFFDSKKNIYLPPHQREIGMVFQEKLLFPHLNVEKNIRFGATEARKQSLSFTELVQLLDISYLLQAYPQSISGGEAQRVALARALFTSPRLLMLDEPFNAVDQQLRRSILPYLKKVQALLDIPMLVISHDLPDLQVLTQHIYVMNKGQIYGGGSIAQLLEHPNIEEIFDLSSFVNTLELHNIRRQTPDLYAAPLGSAGNELLFPASTPIQDSVTVYIRPDEIALSKQPQSGISIRNQVKATIKKCITMPHQVYVLLDVGLPLIAELSKDGFDALGVQAGDTLYALFKARAMK